jgi:hypothetical protein
MAKLEKLPATISFSAKCSDMFGANFFDAKGNEVASYNGYVPDFMPGQHFGDYVQLDIDLPTGQINNWKAPTLQQVNDTLEDGDGT